jgi:hypothetical protein
MIIAATRGCLLLPLLKLLESSLLFIIVLVHIEEIIKGVE